MRANISGTSSKCLTWSRIIPSYVPIKTIFIDSTSKRRTRGTSIASRLPLNIPRFQKHNSRTKGIAAQVAEEYCVINARVRVSIFQLELHKETPTI